MAYVATGAPFSWFQGKLVTVDGPRSWPSAATSLHYRCMKPTCSLHALLCTMVCPPSPCNCIGASGPAALLLRTATDNRNPAMMCTHRCHPLCMLPQLPLPTQSKAQQGCLPDACLCGCVEIAMLSLSARMTSACLGCTAPLSMVRGPGTIPPYPWLAKAGKATHLLHQVHQVRHLLASFLPHLGAHNGMPRLSPDAVTTNACGSSDLHTDCCP